MLNDVLVGGGNRGAHPVCRVHIAAKRFRIAEFAVLCLCGNRLPHIPRLSAAVFDGREVGCVRLIAIARSIGAAAVCDEYKIILYQIQCLLLDEVDGLLFAVLHIQNLLGDFFVAFGFDQDVFHIHAEFDVHAVRFQIFYERQNHTLVLIILCKAQRTEVGQTVDVMHIAAQIPLHFQCTGPALESKHGLPVQPEIRVPEGVRQHIGNFPVLQILFRCQKQLGER